MTKLKPLCPIPSDAKKGDVIVCRNGSKRKFWTFDDLGDALCHEICPGAFSPSGRSWVRRKEWDCVQFIRATTPAPKPKRQDKDAAWLRGVACQLDDDIRTVSRSKIVRVPLDEARSRIRAIAARLQKLAGSGETK